MRRNADPDEGFLDSLYQKHYESIVRYALRLAGGDRQLAEDIAQETFLRAWQHADTLDEARALRWLYTVAHNLAISAHHRGPRTRVSEIQLELADLPPVDDELDRVLEGWLVTDALRDLSVDHRQVLVELFYRRRSVAEAARVLRIPAGTVKSRSYYALRALRNALQEQGVIS